MTLTKNQLFKKRNKKALKRNRIRKDIINKTRRGVIEKLDERGRHAKAVYYKAIRNGDVKLCPKGHVCEIKGQPVPCKCSPAQDTASITVEAGLEVSTSRTDAIKKPLPDKATKSEDDTVKT